MATMAQIAAIANYVYNTSRIQAYTDTSGLTLDYNRVQELGFEISQNSEFYLWSNEETSDINAYYRIFRATYTGYPNDNRLRNYIQAVCIAK